MSYGPNYPDLFRRAGDYVDKIKAVIAEFDAGDHEATLHAMAAEILKHRQSLRLLAKAVGWADVGAPFALIAPGPLWRPRADTSASVRDYGKCAQKGRLNPSLTGCAKQDFVGVPTSEGSATSSA